MFGKAVKFVALFVVCIAAFPISAQAADTIGSEADVALPGHTKYMTIGPTRPADGETVQLDPPRFSWAYDPDQTVDPNNGLIRYFRFQVASDATFTTLIVDVDTDTCTYNFLAPLNVTQAWWRVGYMRPTNPGVVTEWSATRTFYIDPGHTDWDRSDLADETYLTSKAVHPRMIFTAGNLAAIRSWVSSDSKASSRLSLQTTFANNALAASWWDNPTELAAYGTVGSTMKGRFNSMKQVFLVWMLTGDATYLDGGATVDTFLELVNTYVTNSHDRTDDYDGVAITAIALGFDWLYSELTQAQRDIVINAMDRHADWLANYWVFRAHGTSATYSLYRDNPATPINPTQIDTSSHWKFGGSHQIDTLTNGMLAALVGYEHGSNLRELLDLGLHYTIGRTYYAGSEQGHNQGASYGKSAHADVFNLGWLADRIFPEVQFEKNPYYAGIAKWWNWYTPSGIPYSFWADSSYRVAGWTGIDTFGELAGRWLGDGVIYNHFVNDNYNIERLSRRYMYIDLVQPYFDAAPTPATVSTKGDVFPIDGWAMASSLPPSTPQAYDDGVGYVFKCTPRMNVIGHSSFNDLSFQLWAYGECITRTGHNKATNWEYENHSMSHNTLLIDGLGQNQQFAYSYGWDDHFGEITAFKEGSNYVYSAGDGTKCYPPQTFPLSGNGAFAIFVASQGNRNAGHLQKMKRHMLMMRDKYFIVFDECEATVPSQFTWVYHIIDPSWTWADTSKPEFMYEVGNVDVYLKQIGNPATLDIDTWLEGEASHTNPITGETFTDLYVADPATFLATAPRKLWISNKTNSTEQTFMTVIYPVKPGDPVPTITRINDLTVEVVCGGETDIVTFDSAMEGLATLYIDVGKTVGPDASVVGREVFYNNSSFDGNDSAANASDDAAIATDKTALLNGQTATFANYTSYSRGINGIMVDVDGLPAVPTAADFEFAYGNDADPSGWPTAPAPTSVTVRSGAGTAGADRITLIWADNAIESNNWLEVTVKSTAQTGLPADDVFYYGNAIGETGNSATDAQVTPTDEVAVRNNPASLAINPAAITHSCDFNRDKKVGPTDMILCRNNGTNSSTALQLIALVQNTAPTVLAGADQTITLPAGVTLDGTVSDDGYPAPPSAVTTTWTKFTGPGTVTFGDANAVDTTASFSTYGTYVLRLTADDDDQTTSDDVTITVEPVPGTNMPPNVIAGPDQSITLPAGVILDGTVTDDNLPDPPDLVITTWSKTSGAGTVTFGDSSAVDTTATFSVADTYVLRLTAFDDDLTTYDELTITVAAAPTTPGFQESGGMVVMEGENFDDNDTRGDGGGNWSVDTEFTGYVGSSYMKASLTNNGLDWADGSELGFNIDFTTAGTYTIWVHRYAVAGNDCNVHVGMDDTQIGSIFSTAGNYGQWAWKKHTATVTVSPGRHKFQIRKNVTRFRADRIILTTDAGYTPTGTGPAESSKY